MVRKIFYGGQKAENITDDIDVVVYTAAIHPDNPEYVSSVEKKDSYDDTCGTTWRT